MSKTCRQLVAASLLTLTLGFTLPLYAARDRDHGPGDTRERIIRFVQNILRRVKGLDEIVVPRP
jgi:hypothetical protein